MNREYHKWYSSHLYRDMELLVFGHAGKPVLLFPTRMARFYDYENWGIVNALQERIANGEMQLICVDSVDAESFYNNWAHPADRISRYKQYEQYILREVIPFIRDKNHNHQLEVAGCSMGAYHAANIALKHAYLFKKVVCMSDLTRTLHVFRDLFDGYHNEDIYFNMPRQFMANLSDDANLQAIRNMEIIIAIGETDHFISDNREFDQLLWDKGIAHQFYVWEGYAHKPKYWQQMVKLYL
jgi:esterase/lipase superfamily enzyme